MLKKQSITTLLMSAVTVAMLGVTMSACTPTATRRDAPEYAEDAVITTKVKAALIKSSISTAPEIQVETYRGIVQLSGFVDSSEAAQKAAAAVNDVEGVRSVKNDLRIKPSH